MLSLADHEKIAVAVAQADDGTAGEILCVLAGKVSNYRETALAWAAGVALLAPPVGVMLGLHQWALFAPGGWDAGTTSPALAVKLALGGYALAQILLFALVALLIAAIRPLKLALTPKFLRRRRVRQAAMARLMATRLLGAEIGAAVVIFASLEDRMVVVVADDAIHAKVEDDAWDKAVALVLGGIRSDEPAGGFVEAVRYCGDLLATHYPAAPGPHHHLADGVLEM